MLTIRSIPFILILVLLAIAPSHHKIISRSINQVSFKRTSGWNYLDRMVFAPGKISLLIDVKLISKELRIGRFYSLQLAAVPLELWEKESKNKCNLENYTQQQKQMKRQTEFTNKLIFSQDNNYQVKVQVQKEIDREIIFNFVIRDCQNSILKEDLGKFTNIELTLEINNNGISTSATESVYAWFLPLKICLGVMVVVILRRGTEQDNWMKWLLMISMCIEIISIAFKYSGFLVYAYFAGKDYAFFDFMYLLFHSISDSVILVLLILLAFGWTVTFKSTNDFDLYVPLTSMLGLVNVIMTVLNKVTDGDHDKYHIYDSVPAYIMLFFRLIGYFIFMGGIIRSLIMLKADQSKIKRYFIQLGLLGTVYLNFIGFVLIAANYIDSYKRKEFVFCLIQVIKFGLYFYMAFLSGYRKSNYRKLTESSFMQKGDKYF